MKSLYIILVALVSTIACGGIETGEVGVRTSYWGDVSVDEEPVGFYLAVFDNVRKYSIKEVAVELENLIPKAKDNLSLKDMDVTIYYRMNPSSVAEMGIKYAGQSPFNEGYDAYVPCWSLVENVARGVVYDEVAKIESLKMHTQREEIANAVSMALQSKLDEKDKDVFSVTRVVIRSVLTDPSIEQSIQNAIARQKELEAMTTKVEIAAKDAEVKIAEAKGVAEANHIINKSLTREYLQHESNQVLMRFAETGKNNTVVIPANMQTAPLLNIHNSSGD